MALYVFGSRSKEQLFYFSTQTELLINKWDLVFNFLSNIYLIIYVILPILIYRSVSIIISDFEYIILIRLGSYRKWVYQTLNKFFKTFAVLVVVWISVIVILMIGAPPFSGWSPFSELNESLSESQILEKFISMPSLGIFLQFILFTLSLICIHFSLSLIYVMSKRKGIVISIAILLWLYGVASFRILPDSAFFFDLSNYLLLHWGAIGFGNIWGPIIIVVGILLIHIWILGKIDLNQNVFKKSPIWIYILFLVITLIVLWSGTQEASSKNVWDKFIIIFLGGSLNGFNLKAFFSYFIIYVGFIYLIQLYLQRELREIGYYKLLRYHSVNKWFWSWYKKIIIYIGLYLLSLSLFSLILSFLTGSSLSFYISIKDTITIYETLFHFFVNGYLQLLFYTLFVFIIAWLCKETFYSLVGISILSIFMFPGLNAKLIMPYGLNSMGYILNGHSTYYISLVLSIWIIVEIIVILYIFNKKDIDL
ncbi:permease [Cytobacillus citreus]|nr:permease [Cytobacillus citreus]